MHTALYCSGRLEILFLIVERSIHEFNALPNGLPSGRRDFTNLLKPPFSYLRSLGHSILGYIDNTLLVTQDKTAYERGCH